MNDKAKTFFEYINHKKIALCGIGGSHLPLVDLFLKYGAEIHICDSRSSEKLEKTIQSLESKKVTFHLGEQYLDCLSDMDIVFRTPGMKYYLPQLVEARKNGVVVTSEMEVFFDLCPCKIFAVTGSDGKTTTTTIISEILKASGKTVHLGGNIGRPLLPDIENIKNDDFAVVELSSFQLISMRRSPDVAVVTNLAPNHLDIHKDMSEYIDSKKNILIHQNAFSRSILNFDNEITRNFSDLTRGDTLFFSRNTEIRHGAWLDDNNDIIFSNNGQNIKVLNASEIKIPGNHNIENYLAAICAVWGYVSINNIKKVAENFGGVEHRFEFVKEINGVKYYNDSIASSPTRTIAGALSLFDQKLILIAGGYDKKIPFDELGPVVVNKVKLLILMGNTAQKIEDAVKNSSSYAIDNPKIIHVSNMEEAVDAAYKNAVKGDIVAMSPACASFDLYKNFEERGKHFKAVVNSL